MRTQKYFAEKISSWVNDVLPLIQRQRFVLAAFFVHRFALISASYVGMLMTTDREPFISKTWRAFPGNTLLDSFFRWDSGWFHQIATLGYAHAPPGATAFFPLFPYLSRWLGFVVGSDLIAGLLIANVSHLVALGVVFNLTAESFSTKLAERTVVLMLAFPFSFFCAVSYSEGLYLCLSATSIFLFRKRRYFGAGIFGMLSGLTRSSGVLLVAAFGFELARQIIYKQQKPQKQMAWILVTLLAPLFFMWILANEVNDPLAFIKAQARWGRSFSWPHTTLWMAAKSVNWSFPRSDFNLHKVVELIAASGALAISMMMIVSRKFSAELILFVLMGILLPLGTGSTLSMGRFVSVLFPLAIFIALSVRSRALLSLIVYTQGMLLIVFYMRFVDWYWAG